jgi:glutamyl-tRNA synthetase
MDELKPRARNLNELAGSALFLVRNRPLAMDEAAAKLLDPSGRELLAQTQDALAGVPAWTREALEGAAKAVADGAGLGLGKVAGPLRAALTGQGNSPSVFAVMAVLGRDESLSRIEDALN